MELQIEQIPYYLTWKLRQDVMYPELPIEHVQLPEDPDGIHFGLYVDRSLISVVSLFETGETVQLRKFATLKPEQGKGYGKMLLHYLLDLYDSRGNYFFWCNARHAAAKFYEPFGFQQKGHPWEKDGLKFIRMERPVILAAPH